METAKYIALRRDIHRHPELSNQETGTTNRIAAFLKEQDLTLQTFTGLNGGFVRIETGSKKTVAFRADIDALPLNENTGAEFCSTIPGVMHACGHDMHASIAAGLACELNRIKDRLHCNVVILFQPAEENNPVGGAGPVVETGFLEDQHIEAMYGLHLWPSLPVGVVEVKSGPIMAASDKIMIEVIGKTSHAAEPNLGVDAIMVAAKIESALVCDLKREVDPFEPACISIGSFISEGRYNVVSGRVKLEGTMRTTTEATRAYLKKRIPELVSGIAASYRAKAEVTICEGYGVVNNEKSLTDSFVTSARKTLGDENVLTDIHASLIGEDFYYFTRRVPSLYFHLGCDSLFPLHSNQFLPKEEALETGIKLMLDFFQNQQ